MAKEVTTRLVDDLDGGVAFQTVSFTWDSTQYEIDLSKKNLAEFGKKLAPYIENGRKAGKATKAPAKRAAARSAATPSRSAAPKSGLDLGAVRSWAKDAGHAISDRGRVPAWILEAYHTATSTIAAAIEAEPAKAVKKTTARKVPTKKAAPAKATTPAKKAARKSAPRKTTAVVAAPESAPTVDAVAAS